MAVALRLMRFGKKAYPTYRVVVLDKRSKRDGAYIEKVGLYNPMAATQQLQLDEERLAYWLKVGAVVSEGMKKLLTSRQPKKAKRVLKKPVKKVTAKPAKKAEKTVEAPTAVVEAPKEAPVTPTETTPEAAK